MAKTSGFDKAYAELLDIVEDLRSDELSIDQLGSKIKRAKELLKITKEKLRDVEIDVQSLIKEE